MKFKIDKLLSAFGNKSAIESNYADSFTKNIINSINDEPYAISKENVMYAAVKELGGFFYFKTIIVGSFKIKTRQLLFS